MPDNREWASLIWLSIAFFWGLSKKDIRSSFGDFLRAALNPSIIVSLCVMVGYVAMEVWLGSKFSLWRSDLLKPTLIWLIFPGLMLLFNFTKVSEEPHFFRRTVIGMAKFTALLEFYSNLSVLNFLGEFLLQPFLAVLVAISVFTDTTNSDQAVKKFADGLLALIGFSLLIFVAFQLYSTWSEINKHELILQFALPIWLAIGLLPLIYLLGLYANYESAFNRISWATEDSKSRWRARLVLLTKFNFKLRSIHAFAGYWPKNLTLAPNFSAAWQVVTQFQKEKYEGELAAKKESDRLIRYAGSNETDADGRCLDRREFKETIDALRFLATCQMGWYQKPENRYKPELLDMIGDFTQHDLPPDSGITMEVSEDGQAWYAWRRTISGWCFAIGASDPPPDQWEYDGSEPPRGYPDRNRDWGERAFSDEVNLNWFFDSV